MGGLRDLSPEFGEKMQLAYVDVSFWTVTRRTPDGRQDGGKNIA
jgi:hypothetical protein